MLAVDNDTTNLHDLNVPSKKKDKSKEILTVGNDVFNCQKCYKTNITYFIHYFDSWSNQTNSMWIKLQNIFIFGSFDS